MNMIKNFTSVDDRGGCAIILRLAMSSKPDLQLSVILCNSNSYMKKSTYLRVDHYYGLKPSSSLQLSPNSIC